MLNGWYFEYSLRRNSVFREKSLYFVTHGRQNEPTSQAVHCVVPFYDAVQEKKVAERNAFE